MRTTIANRSKRGMPVVATLAVLAFAGVAPAVGQISDEAVSQEAVSQETVSQEAAISNETRAVADRAQGRIRSPFCPGLMLEVCPTPDAARLRDTIQTWAEKGVTADSIVSLVVAQYGEEYRGYPQAEGKGWLAWLVPPGVILLGVLAIVAALKHLRRAGEARALPATEADQDEVRRALREMEEAEGSVF